MSKLSVLFKSFAVIAVIVLAYSCERDDAEPELETTRFSRLYVSFEEYETSTSGERDTNIRIIYPADSSEFKFRIKHIADAHGGGTIYFNPYLRSLVQASANRQGLPDTAVYMMSLSEKTGLLNNRAQFENKFFSFVKGLTYHPRTKSLYVVESRGGNAGIYVISSPENKGTGRIKYTATVAKFLTPGLSTWGAAMASEAIYTSNLGAEPGIFVFKDMVAKIKQVSKEDSTLTIKPDRNLRIADATNLRGLAYDTTKNIMAVVDYPNNQEGVGSGRVLVFANFSSMTDHETITPTRIITGPSTLLEQPTDVAIDTRKEGKFLYVADRKAKKVMRFKIDDQGNVAPDKIVDTKTMGTPVGLALDTRDLSTLGL